MAIGKHKKLAQMRSNWKLLYSAAHFKIVLTNNPPDVTNRESISQWACNVHNIVNKRLEKPIFDCKTISQFYKCGCNETAEAEASIT